jgi:sigma-B regulation protein RsbU (phosphoserine phosphatase)
MRIHTKLFLLLLVISVLPLVALTWRGQRATEALGTSIANASRDALAQGIEVQLQQAVDYSSDVLKARQRLVELALRVQASEVERLLAAPARPDRAARPIYLHTAFEDPAVWPPGTAYSLERSAIAGENRVEALPISRRHQAFFMPEGAAPNPDAMRRLAALDQVYERLNAANQDLFYWQYTTLAEGLHSVYPGHGGYPPGYDPRTRTWYQSALAADDVVWIPPLLDASTRRLLLSAAMPVRGPSGDMVGVTGIDIEILSQLASVHDRIKLGPNAESFILRLTDAAGGSYAPADGAAPPEARIVASSAATNAGGAWDAKIAEAVLTSDTPGGVEAMIADLLSGRGGLRHMVHRGRPAIWVYRQLDRLSTALLYVVPLDDVERIADEAQESIREATFEQVRLAGFASVVLIALVGMAAVVASRSVSRPLRQLAATAADLAGGNLDARAPVVGRDEVGQLAQAFNTMVPLLRSHIEVKESLAVARDVQQKLLPATPPVAAGFDLAAASAYSEAIGGDYYDFIELTDDAGERRIAFVIGDVTGHGIPASLTMTSVRALVRSHADDGRRLLPVMKAINRHLATDASRGTLVTLVYLVLEPATRTLRWVSAGHGPILFFDAETMAVEELAVHDIPLGVQADWEFRESARHLWPNRGVLVIGTDGVWETRNAEGRMFGRDNLIGVVRATAALPARDICAALLSRLAEFRGDVAQGDDVTLIVVKFLDRAA